VHLRTLAKALLTGLFLLSGVLALSLVAVPLLDLSNVPLPGFAPFNIGRGLTTTDLITLTVSGATLLLGLLTGLLALLTWRAVLAGRDEAKIANAALAASQRQTKIAEEQMAISSKQVTIAQETLEASWRPFLVDVPLGRYLDASSHPGFPPSDRAWVQVARKPNSDGWTCGVPLRNIGSGPAIIRATGLEGGGASWSGAGTSASIVAPQELTRITFDVPSDRDDVSDLRTSLHDGQPFVVTVAYSDQSGRNLSYTKAHGCAKGTGDARRWHIRQVGLHNDPNDEPFAMSGPAEPVDDD
jgi:hypothetical protein